MAAEAATLGGWAPWGLILQEAARRAPLTGLRSAGSLCGERGAAGPRGARRRWGRTPAGCGPAMPRATVCRFRAATCPCAHTRSHGLTRAHTHSAAPGTRRRLGNGTSAMPPPPRAHWLPALPHPASGNRTAVTAPRPSRGRGDHAGDPVPLQPLDSGEPRPAPPPGGRGTRCAKRANPGA